MIEVSLTARVSKMGFMPTLSKTTSLARVTFFVCLALSGGEEMPDHKKNVQCKEKYVKNWYQWLDGDDPAKFGVNRVMEFYDTNAELYDQTHGPEQGLFIGAAICADAVKTILGDQYDAKILDIGCGSGILGNELKKRGYKNLEGLDGNEKMLNIAREKKIYTELHQALIGIGSSGHLDGKYDLACASASFIPGHIPPSGLKEVVEKVKPGGYVIVTMNESHLAYYEDLTPLDYASKLFRERLIDEVTIRLIKDYSFAGKGVVMVVRVV